MEKKESVAGHREAKTEKRKSIENAQKQHLGGEERRNSKQVKKKKKSALPRSSFFLQFFLTKHLRFGRNSQFTDLSVHKLALTGQVKLNNLHFISSVPCAGLFADLK